MKGPCRFATLALLKFVRDLESPYELRSHLCHPIACGPQIGDAEARMKISARIANQQGRHNVALETDGREKKLGIAPGGDGFGSSLNGGELLFLALATCYCNDLYREARKRTIEMVRVRVEVHA